MNATANKACEMCQKHECNVQLQFSQNSQVGLQDVLAGLADVAFGRADITADMVTSQQISSRDIFKCLTPVSSNSRIIRGFRAHDGRLVDCPLVQQTFTFVLLCHSCNIGHPCNKRCWVVAPIATCVQNFSTALCCLTS